MKYKWYSIYLLLLLFNASFSQVTPFNHASLHWKTIEGNHHIVHFHLGAERTAQTILSIADEVHQPLVELYKYTPDTKVHWVVYDTDDYANGATYYLNNKIVIWAPALDFEFRGTHHWLRNVVTHEYTHLIQLGAARKWTRQIPGIYIQSIDYEPETRPDVLYGFPNQLLSYPIPNTVVPHWLAEGTAQSMRLGMRYDYRDSHREMMIRTRVLENKLLTLEEMAVFSKRSLESELVYNQGYSLTQYIINRFGEESLQKLSKELASIVNWSFDKQCQKTFGITSSQLYNDWKNYLSETYDRQIQPIKEVRVEGNLIETEGFGNLYPRWSKDGKLIYYVSNKGKDYFSGSKIVSFNIETKKKEKLVTSTAPFAIHPVNNGIIYSSQPLQKGQRRLDDLFYYDLIMKKSFRLTFADRAQQPDISKDGRLMVAVDQQDGTMNLVLYELPDKLNVKRKQKDRLVKQRLTTFNEGEQLARPRFSDDGRFIYFSYAKDDNRDIYVYSFETKRIRPFRTSSWDERDVSLLGDWLYYSSDSTGIWNVYRTNLVTNQTEMLTNVFGGALLSEPSPNGASLVYSHYVADGYKIALLDSLSIVQASNQIIQNNHVNHYPTSTPIPLKEQFDAVNYRPIFEKTYFLPRVAWDYGYFKPGFYLYTNDFLEKINLLGGFALNSKKEYDLYFSSEYRMLPPTMFINVYNIVRRDKKEFEDPFKIVGQIGSGEQARPIYATYGIDYKFNLLETEIGTRYNFNENSVASVYGVISKYEAALNFNDGSPSFGYTYFKGKSINFSFVQSEIQSSITSDVHPSGGYQFGVKFLRSNHNFIEGFKVNAEKLTLQEVYIPYNYWQGEFSAQYFQLIWKSWVVSPSVKLGWIDRKVDPFFHLYAGGLYGMRGYSFYSLGGRNTAIVQLANQVPLWQSRGKQLWLNFFSPTDVFLNVYADVGSVWDSDYEKSKWVRDVGSEIRFSAISFFSYPTAITFSAARGLDRVTVFENNTFTSYEPQWRYYFTVLFNFTQLPTGIRFFDKRWK